MWVFEWVYGWFRPADTGDVRPTFFYEWSDDSRFTEWSDGGSYYEWTDRR